MTSKKNAPQFKYCNVSEATQRTRSFWVLPQLRSCSPDSLSLVPPEAGSPGASPCSEPLTTAVRGPAPARLTQASLWAQLRPPHPRGGAAEPAPRFPSTRDTGVPAPLAARGYQDRPRWEVGGRNRPCDVEKTSLRPLCEAAEDPGGPRQDSVPEKVLRTVPQPREDWQAAHAAHPVQTPPARGAPACAKETARPAPPPLPLRGIPGTFLASHAPASLPGGVPGRSRCPTPPPLPRRGVPGRP